MRFVRYAFFGILGLIVLAIAAPVIFFFAASYYQSLNRYTHHFRLVLEVEDHGEIRTGSSVIRVTITPPVDMLRGLDRGSAVTQGEAVVVELSTRQLVVATLRHGPTGEVDRLDALASRAFGRTQLYWYKNASDWQGVAELSENLIPLIVTFSDVYNAYALRAVPPKAFPEMFGPEIHFHRMWLEMTSGPVTREIEERLPFLATQRQKLGRRYSSPFIVPTADMFIRGK